MSEEKLGLPEPKETEITTEVTIPSDKPNIEVEVIDDRPPEDQKPPRDPKVKVEIPTDDEISKFNETFQKRLKQLKYEYHEERRAKEDALRQNTEAVQYARRLMAEKSQVEQLLHQERGRMAQEAVKSRDDMMKQLEQRAAQAIEAGKPEDAARAQAEMARVGGERAVWGAYQPQPAQQIDPRLYQQQPVQQQQPATPDPQAVDWLRKNRWFGENKRMTGFAYAVHDELVRDKHLDPRSDVYYERLDEAMKERFPEQFDDPDKPKSEQRLKQPAKTVVTAPSRSGAPPARKIQLTRSQEALAKRLGLTLEQYAEQVVKEARNG